MVQKKFFALFLIILTFKSFFVDARICTFFERTFFGNTVANEEYQELCNETKKYFGINENHKLYYAQWPWTYFSSFTLHSGTWINKDVWETLNFNEQVYTMYHEIAHKALAHPLKQYVRTFVTFIISAYFFHKMSVWNKKPRDKLMEQIIINKCGPQALQEPFINKLLNTVITAITSLTVTFIATSSFSEYCEQEADEKAAVALCEQHRKDIIEEQITYLKEIEQEKGNIKNLGFPSLTTQIKYLKKIIERYS